MTLRPDTLPATPAARPAAPAQAPVPVLPVSVVIPTCGRPDLLRGAVASVLAGDAVPAEVLIIDQSRGPLSPLAIPAPPPGCRVRHRASDATCLSAARNEGIALGTQPIVAMIDDDVEVAAGWLRGVVDGLQGDVAAVTGRVRPGPTPAPDDYVPSVYDHAEPEVLTGPVARDMLSGNNFAARREVLEAVGPFDERLGPGSRWAGADDNDYGYRLLAAGHVIRYEPRAELVHHAWRRGRAIVRLRWNYGRGQGGFYAKHLPGARRVMLRRLARDLRIDLAGMVRFAVRRDPWAVTFAAHAVGLVSGVCEWWLRREGPVPAGEASR